MTPGVQGVYFAKSQTGSHCSRLRDGMVSRLESLIYLQLPQEVPCLSHEQFNFTEVCIFYLFFFSLRDFEKHVALKEK